MNHRFALSTFAGIDFAGWFELAVHQDKLDSLQQLLVARWQIDCSLAY